MARPLPDVTGYLLLPDELSAPIAWGNLFGNDAPVEIEVGVGKGLFLITAAAANSQTNYLGIEIARKYAILCASRVANLALPNARVLQADARRFFAGYIPPDSVHAIHVYFPDPWWKRRHKKRRVFTATFVRDVQRVLLPGGELHFWSDVEEYFRAIETLLRSSTALELLSADPEREPEHDMDYLSNFERKMRKAGRAI